MEWRRTWRVTSSGSPVPPLASWGRTSAAPASFSTRSPERARGHTIRGGWRPVPEADLPDQAEPVDDDPEAGGTIVEERVKCGSDCTCNEGNGHGPYRYRYYREDGDLTSKYLGKA